jgi:predicted nucleic acid-binding protein
MTQVVCDASVLLKLLVSEADSLLALELAASYSIVLPDLASLEVANALWSRVHDGSSSAGEAARLLEEFEGFNFDVWSIELQSRRALDLASASIIRSMTVSILRSPRRSRSRLSPPTAAF